MLSILVCSLPANAWIALPRLWAMRGNSRLSRETPAFDWVLCLKTVSVLAIILDGIARVADY